MNSSTSSSDRRRPGLAFPGQTFPGQTFLGLFVSVVGVVGLAIAALLVLADPYDTGRITPFSRAGIPDTGPRMANASRMRSEAFNAAIIGNSTIQLLSPERLNTLTGQRFVQLSMPGTGPMEHAAMLDRMFALRGPGIEVLVLGLETSWCDASRERRTVNPFPFALYDNRPLPYVQWLVRMDAVEFLPRRLRLIAGRERPARPDGYWDYEAGGGYEEYARRPIPTVAMLPPTEGRPAATGALARVLAAAPASTRIVLLHPPIFVHTPSRATADDIRILSECKAALRTLAARRPRTEIVDFWVENDLTRNRGLFLDHNHYRQTMAIRIEAAIVETLGR